MAFAPEMVETGRLLLRRPVPADLDAIFAINSDPRLWTHFPALRHTDPVQTREAMARWDASWESTGLGHWTVRERGSDPVIGYAGASLLGGMVWNIGYRLAVAAHGCGLAREAAEAAMLWADRTDPALPRIAYLLEHNLASAAVARAIGLELVHRGPDAGNPDPEAVRLVFADRALTADQSAVALA